MMSLVFKLNGVVSHRATTRLDTFGGKTPEDLSLGVYGKQRTC